MIKVKFFANLRDDLGIKEISVNASNIKEALENISKIKNVDLKEKLLDENIPKRGVIVLVNGKNIVHMDGIETTLLEGDEVSIFPPVGGG